MSTAIEVTERRVPFCAEMILALKDNKSETRRLVRPQPIVLPNGNMSWQHGETHFGGDPERVKQAIIEHCPYGQPGDAILATETWRICSYDNIKGALGAVKVEYRVDGGVSPWIDIATPAHVRALDRYGNGDYSWHPARYIPKEFSRFRMPLTSVRVERLQAITFEGCVAEGWQEGVCEPITGDAPVMDARVWYMDLWDRLHPECPWESNPWVYVLGFKKVEAI